MGQHAEDILDGTMSELCGSYFEIIADYGSAYTSNGRWNSECCVAHSMLLRERRFASSRIPLQTSYHAIAYRIAYLFALQTIPNRQLQTRRTWTAAYG